MWRVLCVAGAFVVCWWCVSVSLSVSSAAEVELEQGPIQYGNGIPDGVGATLGRFYFTFSSFAGGTSSKALEVLVTSNFVRVDPTSCSAASPGPCHPTKLVDPIMTLKLAGAGYLPVNHGPATGGSKRDGCSLETAMEGPLYVAATAPPSSAARLLLNEAEPSKVLAWGLGSDGPSGGRPYESHTGTAFLVGDDEYLLLQGWLEGVVAANDGWTVVVEFQEASLPPARWSSGDEEILVSPDYEGAEKAGLPPGVFGLLEVNYSGMPTESSVVAGAVSSDVEVHVTAVPRTRRIQRGDCDGNGTLGQPLSEVLTALGFYFLGNPAPPCLAACDFNGDGKAVGEISDAVYLLYHYFLGGPAPPPPFPDCGTEPEPSELSCDIESCPAP
jgi:hypothetical protein